MHRHFLTLYPQPTPRLVNASGGGGGGVAPQPVQAGDKVALNEDGRVELNEDGTPVLE